MFRLIHHLFLVTAVRACIGLGGLDGGGKGAVEVNMGSRICSFSSSFLAGPTLIGLSGFWTGLTAYTTRS